MKKKHGKQNAVIPFFGFILYLSVQLFILLHLHSLNSWNMACKRIFYQRPERKQVFQSHDRRWNHPTPLCWVHYSLFHMLSVMWMKLALNFIRSDIAKYYWGFANSLKFAIFFFFLKNAGSFVLLYSVEKGTKSWFSPNQALFSYSCFESLKI